MAPIIACDSRTCRKHCHLKMTYFSVLLLQCIALLLTINKRKKQWSTLIDPWNLVCGVNIDIHLHLSKMPKEAKQRQDDNIPPPPQNNVGTDWYNL